MMPVVAEMAPRISRPDLEVVSGRERVVVSRVLVAQIDWKILVTSRIRIRSLKQKGKNPSNKLDDRGHQVQAPRLE
jgi:hypothetical protein